jgi:DNA-binding Lrp family transcriptional regulator
MSFRHVVMFRFEDHVDDEHVARISEALSALPAAIDVIRDYVHGRDLGVSEGNYDYVVVADFDDVDGYCTYRDHPQHVAMIAELVKGNVAERAAVQYETRPS